MPCHHLDLGIGHDGRQTEQVGGPSSVCGQVLWAVPVQRSDDAMIVQVIGKGIGPPSSHDEWAGGGRIDDLHCRQGVQNALSGSTNPTGIPCQVEGGECPRRTSSWTNGLPSLVGKVLGALEGVHAGVGEETLPSGCEVLIQLGPWSDAVQMRSGMIRAQAHTRHPGELGQRQQLAGARHLKTPHWANRRLRLRATRPLQSQAVMAPGRRIPIGRDAAMPACPIRTVLVTRTRRPRLPRPAEVARSTLHFTQPIGRVVQKAVCGVDDETCAVPAGLGQHLVQLWGLDVSVGTAVHDDRTAGIGMQPLHRLGKMLGVHEQVGTTAHPTHRHALQLPRGDHRLAAVLGQDDMAGSGVTTVPGDEGECLPTQGDRLH